MIKRKTRDRDFARKQRSLAAEVEKKYGRRNVVKEKMSCPVCKKSYIEFNVYATGGSSGRCQTPGCVWWCNV